MEHDLTYPVDLVEGDGAIRAIFRDWDDTETFGDDREGVMAMAQDLLETMASSLISEGGTFPTPSHANGSAVVGLSAISAAKVCLYMAMQKSDVSKAELSRRLGWHPPQVQRLLDLRHKSRMDQIEQALAAVGKRLVVSIQDAA